MTSQTRRLAVISGGGTGIGAATARTLAGVGYGVVIIGRRADVLTETAAGIRTAAPEVRVDALAADLTDPVQARQVADAIGDRTVDVLVNNAGAFVGAGGDDLAALASQWRATLDSNVLTAVLLTEALLPRLRRPGGRIVLLSSIAAQRGGGGPYSAAKAALHGWVTDLAVRLGPDGITANVVAPGYIVDTEFFAGRMTPEGHATRVGATLLKRPGEPEDIAATVSWLAQESGRFVTGQIIGVNGGSVLGR